MNEERLLFETFKSNVCHRVKDKGEINFMIEVLETDIITEYYKKNWFPECLYLLGMIDYLSRKNGVPVCKNYEKLRHCKLDRIVYPKGILITSVLMKKPELLQESYDNAIPEFRRFNIVENEVENIV